MASSSSSRTWRYNVFTSFHGPDVRKTFLSHLRKQFNYNGITMFNDQGIERGQTIAPALTQAIKESRISIVVLTKNYASSSWCLDELLEILKCKEDIGQIVMTVFYGVDPSDVRKQTGDFGRSFNETCASKTKDKRRRWSQVLNDVGNIAGEHFLNWDNEATMIEKIAKDVSDKLNVTPSRDFDGMIGIEAHLRKVQSLLHLDYDGTMMVGIYGPAGIGKTTIARALHSLLSNRFQLTCFVDNLRGNYHSGFDEYGLKLRLQEQFLSNILNQNGTKVSHLGAIEERLRDIKVLIILDDVNNIKQLEALANKTTWFGPGSRIVVTTENQELLQQHSIDNTYYVGFPSKEEALAILCSYSFKQISPHQGFEELAKRITELCGNLPLGLRVIGSNLRGKEEDEWEDVVTRLETILDRDIGDVLRVGYESLDENEQTLFLHIAIFFNYKDGDLVKAMFADNNLDVKRGLKILANRSLIEMDEKRIEMHRLLWQMARQVISKQEPWKRQILMDAHEIHDALENKKGSSNVVGISFDTSRTSEVSISSKALKKMPNFRFLRVYGNDKVHIPEDMEFPLRLRFLHWKAYPSKCLPPTFHPENLVELNMQQSQLEKLWQGTQSLNNLKKMYLSFSPHLKELPDLSNATNMELLDLISCTSLVEIPSSCKNLQKLQKLFMINCINLEVIPDQLNLSSLEILWMRGCKKLRNFPGMSTNIILLDISETAVEDVSGSIRHCSRLLCLDLTSCSGNINDGLTYLPWSLIELNISYSDIERIPDCIKDLHQLQTLDISGCRRLTSLSKLSDSIEYLYADDCESLETISLPLNTSFTQLSFTNCFKLGQQAREIIQQSFVKAWALNPGIEVPTEFNHRAKGNILKIPKSDFTSFKFCVVISHSHQIREDLGQFLHCSQLLCRRIINGDSDFVDHVIHLKVGKDYKFQTEHLLISGIRFLEAYPSEVIGETVFEFNSNFNDSDIIECGVQILTDERIEESYELELDQVLEDDIGFEHSESCEDEIEYGNSTNGILCDSREEENFDCWCWFFHCFDLSNITRNLGWGRRR